MQRENYLCVQKCAQKINIFKIEAEHINNH